VENKNCLVEIQNATSVEDFNNPSPENFGKIVEAIINGKIDQEQLKTIAKNFPLPFLNSQIAFIKTLQLTIDKAAINQHSAIRSVAESLNNCERVLYHLSYDLKSESAKIEMAKRAVDLAKLNVEIAKIQADMNKNNNNFFAFAITACVTLFAIFTGFDDNSNEF
jgi:hypothetical protein